MNDLKLIIAMARSYNTLFSKIEKNIQEYGLTISEFGVLELLFHKGEQPIQKIADKILVTSGTITYVIDKLQKKGFVVRKKCDKDRRVFYVSLTTEGTTLISDVFPKHEAFIKYMLKGIEEERKEQLIGDLITLNNQLK